MTPLVPISLYGWIFVAIGMFAVLPPRRAVLAAYLLAWLFLPQATIDVPGFPDLNKMNVTSYGALLGVLLFDFRKLTQYRLSWVDIPIILWCLSSLPSALTNELPPNASSQLYDGLSGVFADVMTWGLPYLMGRLYFTDLPALRELAIGVFMGGLVYVPLCLYELRMSPCLHDMVYGFHPSSFLMTLRYGGYRPMVFMEHGLMLGMWMASASLVGFWLWRTRSFTRLFNIPVGPLAIGLIAVTVMCKSTGAIILLLVGILALELNRHMRSTAALVVLVSITPAYMLVRAEGLWSGEQIVRLAAMIDEERADSLLGRLENEDMLVDKAAQKPVFGWGGYGRWRVFDPKTGEDITVSDGLWVIALGEKGLFGLTMLTLFILLPFVLLLRRFGAAYWSHPWVAGPAALAMVLMLYSVDNLFNAMVNPVYFLAAGALSGFYVAIGAAQYAQKPVDTQVQTQPALPRRFHLRAVQSNH